jgi:hypothetical protein
LGLVSGRVEGEVVAGVVLSGWVSVCDAGGRGTWGSGLQALEADFVERGDKIGGPGPGGGETEPGAAPAAGDLAGGV